MDLMYLPDTITYPTFRGSTNVYQYEPDAPLWIKAGQPHVQQPQQKATTEIQEKRGNHGGSCPLCKERQRRRLATYIRSKSRQDSECTIEEEDEEESKQTQEKQDCKRQSTSK